ncbi:hypothetical protein I302_108256 [Kwoniella bestiolae CBS 10118]|uniref:DNA endonuclease activator Ctp1 C-terminal domain-containing protein n=1 Tax=Kwoniella bestiolae CBS 10118 TaxID=1296100 RepID=A0A1B9FW82_9TREE|nr:hypothetical protein I302_07378 [Kwoniella bestiolae CBS 10118]OCF23028.1 hypothetical protein I302_07378 [Kwoniella bestiolae CBS 10118]
MPLNSRDGEIGERVGGVEWVGDDTGDEWERQLAKFNEMSSAVQEMTPIFTSLRAKCNDLKQRQQSLEADVTQKKNEATDLKEEIARLKIERDIMNNAQNDNTWWNSRALSGSVSMTALSEGDVQGKLNRRVWLLDEQVRHLKQEQQNHEDEMERERAISAGLRDRISVLEMKRRELREDNAKMQQKDVKLSGRIANLELELEDLTKKNDADVYDLKESLRKEEMESGNLRDEISRLKEERDNAIAEMIRTKADAAEQAIRSPKILQSQDLNIPSSHPSQALSSQPMTPTKPKSSKPFTPLLNSPSSRVGPPSPTSLARQYAVLEARCNHLQAAYNHQSEAHKLLVGEHKKLRKIHQEDIDHMKKYQASQIERKKKKDERRAQKKIREMTNTPDEVASSGKTIGNQDGPFPVGGVLVEESESFPRVKNSTLTKERIVDDEEEYLAHAQQQFEEEVKERYDVEPRMTSDELVEAIDNFQVPFLPRSQTQTIRPRSHHRTRSTTSSTSRQSPTKQQGSTPLRKDDMVPRGGSPALAPSTQRARRSSTSTSSTVTTPQQPKLSASTPQTYKRILQPTHVTPWLGVENDNPSNPARSRSRSRSQSPTKRKRVNVITNEEDDFASPPDASTSTSTPTTVRTPLVRDRLGGGSVILGGESLRKKVMRQTIVEAETPMRGQKDSTPGPSTRIHSSTQGSEMTSTGKKRKILDTETEGLSPSEKALKLRRLAKMPVSEKRELYKGYKGNGRYVKPEDMSKTVNEEYEINPSQNDGHSFAYHDVRRKKEDRRGMHGGDCECCRDWYEVIGDIPRFNQPPKWRDEHEEVVERDQGDYVREHQNMVSRHRETWIRPPTPPGYWKIGFPSSQDVREQNREADRMLREKEERIRREAQQKDGKWRKKKSTKVSVVEKDNDDTVVPR